MCLRIAAACSAALPMYVAGVIFMRLSFASAGISSFDTNALSVSPFTWRGARVVLLSVHCKHRDS